MWSVKIWTKFRISTGVNDVNCMIYIYIRNHEFHVTHVPLGDFLIFHI